MIVLAAAATVTAQAAPDVETLLARVSGRLADYYKRAQSVVCIEKSTVQPIGSSFNPTGFARVTESELRVEPDLETEGDGGATNARVIRQIVRINGRPPREKDKNDRAGCTDPNPLTTEPLAFLLPGNRKGYTFTAGGFGKGKDARLLILDFKTDTSDSEGKLVESERGIEGCFSVTVPVRQRGRIWVDAETYQVVRLETHLVGIGDLRASWAMQRKHNLPSYITIERLDTAIRYRPISFTDPDEAMLLPESIETTTVWRNGLESTRQRQEYTDYRRFLTAGRIVK